MFASMELASPLLIIDTLAGSTVYALFSIYHLVYCTIFAEFPVVI
jgi:hypothetical protein